MQEAAALPVEVKKQHAEAERAALLAVRATNRPDEWQRLLQLETAAE
jgi:hypothetical protein